MRKKLFTLLFAATLALAPGLAYAQPFIDPLSTKDKSAEDLATLQQEAAQGNATAQFKLGQLYALGRGVRKDPIEAFQWCRKAAEQGLAIAQFTLGTLYAGGEGVKQDYAQAVQWFRKAAEQGSSDAQFNLGLAYLTGKGIPADAYQAAVWFRKSADQGQAKAQFLLGDLYAKGQGTPKDDVQAFAWTDKAAKQGLPLAQANLSLMYSRGYGTSPNHVQALYWLAMVADQGVMYFNGQRRSVDIADAIQWFERSADSGRPEGGLGLGMIYYGLQESCPKTSGIHCVWSGANAPLQMNEVLVTGHKWFTLAKTGFQPESPLYIAANRGLDALTKRMSPEQIAQAQQEAMAWLKTHNKPTSAIQN